MHCLRMAVPFALCPPSNASILSYSATPSMIPGTYGSIRHLLLLIVTKNINTDPSRVSYLGESVFHTNVTSVNQHSFRITLLLTRCPVMVLLVVHIATAVYDKYDERVKRELCFEEICTTVPTSFIKRSERTKRAVYLVGLTSFSSRWFLQTLRGANTEKYTMLQSTTGRSALGNTSLSLFHNKYTW